MALPSIAVDVDDIGIPYFNWSRAITTRVSPMLVVIALIILKLVVQISRSPEQDLIQ